MKFSIVFSALCFSLFQFTYAQNIGIGTNNPAEKLTVYGGNFLVQQPYTGPVNQPTVAQTVTMVNNTQINYTPADSTGSIYDPGGPAGNYLPNLLANVLVSNNMPGVIGFQLTIESMQLNTGDSLIILNSCGTDTLFRAGNNNNVTGTFTFNCCGLDIYFTSNADANVGAGFSLVFKRLFAQPAPVFNAALGNALFFDVSKGSFAAGKQFQGLH